MSSSVVSGGDRREWITVDALGLFGVDGNNWIKSNQIKSIVVNEW